MRLANVYGPRDTGRVIPLWLDEATDRRPLTIFGGRQVIDFVWIDYVVEALLRAAEIAGPLPPINVGSGTGTRIIDLARRIIRLFGRHSQIHIRPARSVDVGRFVADVNRMRQMLGIEPPNDPLAQLDALAGRIPTAATV
jgi:UDP-glucose 4-epimerase